MENIMLDLETLDTRTTGVILAIGAVAFTKTGITSEFYCTVDAQTAIDLGLTVSGSTFKWWMAQSGAARKALFEDNVTIQSALYEFSDWVEENTVGENVKVWGNGSDFDNAMLAHAYNKQGLDVPWKFWNNRCYRTACQMLNDYNRKQQGVHHNALDDARSQANHMIHAMTMRGVW